MAGKRCSYLSGGKIPHLEVMVVLAAADGCAAIRRKCDDCHAAGVGSEYYPQAAAGEIPHVQVAVTAADSRVTIGCCCYGLHLAERTAEWRLDTTVGEVPDSHGSVASAGDCVSAARSDSHREDGT
jgi:hypothetical protein